MATLGEPVPTDDGNYYTVEGTRNLSIRAEKKGELLKAADGFEQVFLGCMQPGVNFTRSPAYLSVPSHLAKLRAVGLAKAGKFDESKREASASLAAWPANLDVAIGLVPVLEKAGLAAGEAQAWLAAWPELRSDCDDDSRACSRFWTLGGKLRARLPKRTERNAAQAAASGLIHAKERELRDGLQREHPETDLGVLSMGMSNDYPVAIEEGATTVRIGRAKFGE